MIKLYGIRDKKTGEQVLEEGLYLEDKENCLKFLATTPDPDRYEMISQEVEVTLKSEGRKLYMQTVRGPVVVEAVGGVDE